VLGIKSIETGKRNPSYFLRLGVGRAGGSREI
jgi:hypothetical protein